MKINLSPIAADTKTTIEAQGDTLICNNVSYDFSTIQDGAEIEAVPPMIGKIKRINGEIELTIEYQYNSMECSIEERYPNNPYTINGVLDI